MTDHDGDAEHEHQDEHELLDAGEDAAMLDALRRQWWPWLLASGADPVAAALTTDGRPAAILVINTGLSREDLAEATPRIAATLIEVAARMTGSTTAGDIVPPDWTE